MAKLQQRASDDTDGILAALRQDGGVIARDFFPTDLITRVRNDMQRSLTEVDWCNVTDSLPNEFFGLTTKRLHGVLQHSEAAEALMCAPTTLRLAREVLGKRVIVSTGELMAIGPSETRQMLHADADSWARSELDQELLFSINIALTDFTRENGATVVVPGSHRWKERREPDPSELAHAEMAAGSALLYSGRVLHGGGSNRTEQTRIGLYFGYIPSWLRPLENFALTLPPACVEKLGDETRTLIGCPDGGFTALL